MKRRMAVLAVVVALAVAASAVEGNDVAYLGGTVATLQSGVIGHLDTASASEVAFQHAGGRVAIPYASIQSYEYSTEVSHHLGVAPAIAVGLLKKRQRNHFIRVTYTDAANMAQVAVFEVPKQMPRTLMAILQSRAPQGCKAVSPCSVRQW